VDRREFVREAAANTTGTVLGGVILLLLGQLFGLVKNVPTLATVGALGVLLGAMLGSWVLGARHGWSAFGREVRRIRESPEYRDEILREGRED
jgi:hypothetical protein